MGDAEKVEAILRQFDSLVGQSPDETDALFSGWS